MNYTNKNMSDHLAYRYVIGVMRGSARQRFESLLLTSPTLSDDVKRWEKHLNAMVDQLAEVEPEQSTWEEIKKRVFGAKKNSLRASIWRWWGGLATCTALALIIFLVQLQPMSDSSQEQPIAFIQDENKKTLWVLQIEDGRIQVMTKSNVEAQPAKDYQLWMLPNDDSPPVSLGLLPKKAQSEKRLIPKSLMVSDIAALAVSLEPEGGSPTGLPTGPVLYTTDIVML